MDKPARVFGQLSIVSSERVVIANKLYVKMIVKEPNITAIPGRGPHILTLMFSVKKQKIRTGVINSWFNYDYSEIARNFSKIANMPVKEAIEWSRSRFKEETDKSQLEIFSFKVRGFTVGMFLPWVVLALLVFILGYALNIRYFIKKNQLFNILSPTLLCATGKVPAFVCFMTLIILPLISQFSIIYTYTIEGTFDSYFYFGTITFLIGFWALYVLRNIFCKNDLLQYVLWRKWFKNETKEQFKEPKNDNESKSFDGYIT